MFGMSYDQTLLKFRDHSFTPSLVFSCYEIGFVCQMDETRSVEGKECGTDVL